MISNLQSGDGWMAKFHTMNEVVHPNHAESGWRLYLQWGEYRFDQCEKRDPVNGYRFVWRRPSRTTAGRPNAIQSRPARIPSIKDIETLISEARSQGWGRFKGSPVEQD
jgi:hypothetical protein